MIDLSQGELALLLVRSLTSGLLLGLAYDFIRAFKMLCGISYFQNDRTKAVFWRVIGHIITFFFDIFFFFVSGVVSLLLIYRMGGGIFRGFTYGGIILGFCLYHFTLGNLTLRLSHIIVNAVKIIVKKVIFLILFPLKKIFSLIFSLYRLTIGKIIGKIIREIKCRAVRKEVAPEEEKSPPESEGREEEYVYVGSKKCYRKSGRISFGYSGNRSEP
jgi:hypothetical protein